MRISEPAGAPAPEPAPDCGRCRRLVEFRSANRNAHPDWFNGAVRSFGPEDARLLVVGLAPGLRGANRTGRPFTGDHAGELLYSTLAGLGFATGHYGADPADGLSLRGCMITNAVRCVPPGNKPTGAEIAVCRAFLAARIAALPRLQAILALGRIAHDSVVRAMGLRLAAHPFAHGAVHILGALTLHDSYHCSRYNTNTGRLSEEMLRAVFEGVRARLG